MRTPFLRSISAAIALCAAAGALAGDGSGEAAPPRRELALMGTVPIYWGEAAGITDVLAGRAAPHWARAAIEQDFDLAPIDFLTAESLAGHDLLFMPQPRGLAPQENVALDSWVRAGGRLLLLADPRMTGESRFAIGDRRRRQDVALLSPILAHWGLELRFDEAQGEGWALGEIAGTAVPVRLSGRLSLTGVGGSCSLLGGGEFAGLAAHCRVGEGEALVLADAALLESDAGQPVAEEALRALLRQIFGDGAGPPNR